MSFSPSIPARAAPSAPNPNDPNIQAAARAASVNAQNMYGRNQTLLTSGMGDTTAPSIGKKTILGG
jgi:hypothetical protein